MKEILYLHPAGQAFAFICGLFNLLTGLTRRMFNISIHVNCGAIYYFMSLVGAGVGVLATKYAEKTGIPLEMELHETLSMAAILIMAMGATTGLVMMSRPARRAALLKVHRWVNVVSIAIYIVQGATGLAALLRI